MDIKEIEIMIENLEHSLNEFKRDLKFMKLYGKRLLKLFKNENENIKNREFA